MSATLGKKNVEKGYLFTASHHVVTEADGTQVRKQKLIKLGRSKPIAEKKIEVLNAYYRLDTATFDGKKVWSPEQLQLALTEMNKRAGETEQQITALQGLNKGIFTMAAIGVPTPENPNPAPTFPMPKVIPPISTIMFYEALDLWEKSEKQRFEAGDISAYHASGAKKINSAVRAFVPNFPLHELNSTSALQTKLRYVFTKRPVSATTEKPISPEYVKNMLAALGRFLKWAKTEKHWDAVIDYMDVFKLDKKKQKRLMTEDDKVVAIREQGSNPFTFDECKILWSLASTRQRCLMAIGLCFGWSNIDVAHIRADHAKYKNDEMFIQCYRHKSTVEGAWWVCPPLRTMLEERIARANKGTSKLLFRTPGGELLVRHNEKLTHIDEIRATWEDLMELATKKGVRKFGFSSLRDTGAQMMQNHSDAHLSSVFMAHSGSGVYAVHYGNSNSKVGVGETEWDRVHKAQRKMYESLKPMFDAKALTTAQVIDKVVNKVA